MAQDLTVAYDALEKAHAAGDTARAQTIADHIREEQAKAAAVSASGATSALPMHPAEMVSDGLSSLNPANWFKAQDPKEVSLKEAISGVTGGSAAGAAGAAILPGALKAGGKLVPGVIGKGLDLLGNAMSAIPLKERIVKGAGGGAVMGGVEKLGEALGAPPAVTAAASLVGGGIGESATSFLTKETGQLLRFVGNASYGNVAGASRARLCRHSSKVSARRFRHWIV